jgi:hypothetical protein
VERIPLFSELAVRRSEYLDESLIDPVLNKIDALLTLTELSLLADKAVIHLVFLSSQSQSFIRCRADH